MVAARSCDCSHPGDDLRSCRRGDGAASCVVDEGVEWGWHNRFTSLLMLFVGILLRRYEFKVSTETGHFLQHPTLHTSIAVKVDREPHDSFRWPNKVHRRVEGVITIFLPTWTIFI